MTVAVIPPFPAMSSRIAWNSTACSSLTRSSLMSANLWMGNPSMSSFDGGDATGAWVAAGVDGSASDDAPLAHVPDVKRTGRSQTSERAWNRMSRSLCWEIDRLEDWRCGGEHLVEACIGSHDHDREGACRRVFRKIDQIEPR